MKLKLECVVEKKKADGTIKQVRRPVILDLQPGFVLYNSRNLDLFEKLEKEVKKVLLVEFPNLDRQQFYIDRILVPRR